MLWLCKMPPQVVKPSVVEKVHIVTSIWNLELKSQQPFFGMEKSITLQSRGKIRVIDIDHRQKLSVANEQKTVPDIHVTFFGPGFQLFLRLIHFSHYTQFLHSFFLDLQINRFARAANIALRVSLLYLKAYTHTLYASGENQSKSKKE